MKYPLTRRTFAQALTAAGLAARLGDTSAAQMPPGVSRPASAPAQLSELSFRELGQRVSNWGRWGADDRRGALNFITPDSVRAATKLVTSGDVVQCGAPTRTIQLKLSVDAAADWLAINDQIALTVHGRGGPTHLDALGHIYYQGLGYNGQRFGGIKGDQVAVGSIAFARTGIVSRGVLIDLPRMVGREWLEPGTLISAAELRQAMAAAKIVLQRGDVLFVRTGRFARERAKLPQGTSAETGGLAVDCAELIHKSEPAVLVSDAGTDTATPQVENVLIPWHILCLVYMGLPLVDGADLEMLADKCARERRKSFLTTIAPLEIPGGTSSPVNPLCVF